MDEPNQKNQLSFQPVNTSNFSDFEYLFAERGTCEGCWCMYWRLQAEEFDAGKGDGNRLAMKKMVESGQVPGIIVYNDDEPIGWCSFGNREDFPRLSKSDELLDIEDRDAWVITCLFVKRNWRRRGVKRALLRHLMDYCIAKGAKLIEGYPCNSTFSKYPDAFAWTGISKAYKAVGFKEVSVETGKKPIMRCYL